jgi:hypothetical protein
VEAILCFSTQEREVSAACLAVHANTDVEGLRDPFSTCQPFEAFVEVGGRQLGEMRLVATSPISSLTEDIAHGPNILDMESTIGLLASQQCDSLTELGHDGPVAVGNLPRQRRGVKPHDFKLTGRLSGRQGLRGYADGNPSERAQKTVRSLW